MRPSGTDLPQHTQILGNGEMDLSFSILFSSLVRGCGVYRKGFANIRRLSCSLLKEHGKGSPFSRFLLPTAIKRHRNADTL